MKRAVQLFIFVLCVGFTVSAVVNVFSDNSEVEKMAKEIACEAPSAKPSAAPSGKPAAAAAPKPVECSMTMTRMSRTPFGQSFEFTGRSGARAVRCTRSLVMVGDYGCKPE